MTNWRDRVILVTGGTRGIGRACVELSVRCGASVVFTGVSHASVEQTLTEIRLKNQDARVYGTTYDQARPDDVLTLLKRVKEEFNGLDHVVANAGIHTAAPVGMIDDDSLDQLFQINSIGVLRLIQGSLKLLRKSPSPSIVLLGSIMAMDGVAGQAGYAMSKAAIAGLVRPLAREIGPRGIRINCVLPGYIATDMTARLSEDSVSALVERTPIGRIGRPKEVADAVLYLLSDESSFITGSFLEVNGGLTN